MTATIIAEGSESIVRAHGGGGELMGRLIHDEILGVLGNSVLNELTDGAILPAVAGPLAITTDSFVVQPLEFSGGTIGRLAVCGTVNDLSVMGARPLALSLGLILEEGLDLALLRRVLESLAEAAKEAGVPIVTGDTKVIERGSGSGVLINTAGIGEVDARIRVGFDRIESGDMILVSGTLGDHGMAVMSKRNGIEFSTPIVSDAAPLNGLIMDVADAGVDIHFMRDPTRGGLAGVLADISERTQMSVEVHESRIPCRPEVASAAQMLGFDLLNIANEGKVVMVVPPDDVSRALDRMHGHPYGTKASCIGSVVAGDFLVVEMVTALGGRRVVQRPYGEELPRIC